MKISAIEEYGLRCLLQLARTDTLISADEVAIKEGLSLAYVEKILSHLRKVGLVKSVRGMYGGYQLSRPPEEISVGEFVRSADGDFFSEICHNFSGKQSTCVHLNGGCSVRPVWLMVARHLYRILDHLTLADLLKDENHLEQTLFNEFPLPVKAK